MRRLRTYQISANYFENRPEPIHLQYFEVLPAILDDNFPLSTLEQIPPHTLSLDYFDISQKNHSYRIN
jgi:hypothetical protein